MEYYVELYCEGCDGFFECECELAAQHERLARDPNFMTPILCHECTLQAMIEEETGCDDIEDEIDRMVELMEMGRI